MPTLSACIIVYNEEQRIAGCLDSLAGIVDDIVVVHDGSCSDKTLEIARAHGARVFVGKHYGYMEPQLPLAYREARGDWLLRIDADERLSDGLKRALPDLLKRDDVDAYEFLWRLHDGTRHLTKRWPYKRCLFRKAAVSFLAIPDYVAQVPGKVERLDYELEHFPGYDNHGWEMFKRKWIGLAHIRANVYTSDFKDAPSFNYDGTEWPRSIKLRRRWPLLILIPDALIVFVKTWYDGFQEGPIALKAALSQAGLRILIDWFIFKKQIASV